MLARVWFFERRGFGGKECFTSEKWVEKTGAVFVISRRALFHGG